MNKEDEYRLIGLAKDGDEKSMTKLIECYTPYAKAVAYKIHRPNNQDAKADINAAALVGLMKAVRSFDLSRDVRFSTYSYYWIKACVIETLHERMQEPTDDVDDYAEDLSDPVADEELAILELRAYVRDVLDRSTYLNRIEKRYARLRWISGMSRLEISAEMGFTKQRCAQIEACALKKLSISIKL